jgi:hypothetical protein
LLSASLVFLGGVTENSEMLLGGDAPLLMVSVPEKPL